MPKYSGSCHCGKITFQIDADIAELTTCDCSLCVKKNALMATVHESDFELLSGKEHLSQYQWNTKIARHFFCSHCGIYPFHKKRAMPDHYGVNVYCLEDFVVGDTPVRRAEGSLRTLVANGARPEWPGPRTV